MVCFTIVTINQLGERKNVNSSKRSTFEQETDISERCSTRNNCQRCGPNKATEKARKDMEDNMDETKM